ncbi:hypothetical protein [Nocardioides sp. B-3]|uniref:hypothetical protein n=1 Tax=Nocardioides sp. B-3 TaxID=2895565 RepID=UPI00215394DE|nr:hypothetical protein [Nocardioides sp. B-3]UUZ60532.1 hypothetical protein LP418_06580 [Nocardioides sp. B-3]
MGNLDRYCDLAVTFLERQVSPEIPLAIAALDELRGLIRDTADELAAMGTSCEEYAEAVRATHQRTLDLLAEIGRMVVEGAAISLIVGGLTGGLGAGAAGTAAVARIAARAPRFHALLTTLRVTVTASATRIRVAREGLDVARARFQTFARARVRSERGAIKLPGGGARSGRQFQGSPKHGSSPHGRASAGPMDGQAALDRSVAISPATTTRRVSFDADHDQFVVFDETTRGVFHGHVREWSELTPSMQTALKRSGIVDRKGRPVE